MSYSIALSNPALPGKIPSTSDVVEAARNLIASDLATQWKAGKTFDVKLASNATIRKVPTYSRKVGQKGETWFMRVTQHDKEDGSFDEFWQGLGVDHAEHEAQYIPEIVNASLIQMVEPRVSEVWSLHYTFGALLSQRTFTVLLVTRKQSVSPSSKLREGFVVSIPFDTSSDKDLRKLEGAWGENGKGGVGVKGKYAAVEWIKELDDGRVEWRMATTSEPGGMIPGFLASGAIPGAIANDVKHYLNWMSTNRKNPAPRAPPSVVVETPGGSNFIPQGEAI